MEKINQKLEKIFLKLDVVTDSKLSHCGLLAYIALRIWMANSVLLRNQDAFTDCVSVCRLAYLITQDEEYDSNIGEIITNGIVELSDRRITKIKNRISTDSYYLDFTNLWLDTKQKENKFAVLCRSDASAILHFNEKLDKRIRILRYYTILISTFDWSKKAKIGYMSISYICKLSGYSDRTCQRYNSTLEQNKILYVYRSNDKIAYKNRMKQIRNCYSRYVDKEECKKYAMEFEQEFGEEHKIEHTKIAKEKTNNNRRLAQLYNRICDGHGNDYDENTIKEVYSYILKKNKILKSNGEKPKSLSAFYEYDFLWEW